MKSKQFKRVQKLFAAGLLVVGTTVATNVAIGDLSRKPVPSPVSQMTPEVQAAIANASTISTAFRGVSEAVLPSVVAIENSVELAQVTQPGRLMPSQDRFGGQNPFRGTPLEEFFKDGFPNGQMPPGMRRMPVPRSPGAGSQARKGIGSGVIIDPSGIILTNNHVVEGGGTVTVKLQDGREYKAREVLTDPDTDVAVVKIDASNLPAVPLGDSEVLGIGEFVLAMGQPFGLEGSVTSGIVSAKNRGIITNSADFIQTDAAINPGNSGGPLVNLRGEVIGINTAINSRSGGNEGIGFAIPSNMAGWVVDQLLNDGRVRRAYLGIGIEEVTAERANQYDLKPGVGVFVREVFDNTPAAATGLLPSDVVLKFDGRAVSSPSELQVLVEQSNFGSDVPVLILRDGEQMTLSYQPTERPQGFRKRAARPQSDASESNAWGFSATELTPALSKKFGLSVESGVMIEQVEDASPAARAGLEPGMVITKVGRTPITDMVSLKKQLDQAKDSVVLYLRTASGSRVAVLEKS
ncbi:MAG: Do family serine endopeptidase [Planctomycetota bacterium]